MYEIEDYPETMVEILRSLYFSGRLQASSDLRSALEKKGIEVEARTIRYHLTNLEKAAMVRRYGNRGVVITEKGVAEAKMLLVFDRVGGLAMETERLSLECDYSPLSGKGTVMVNSLLVDEGKIPLALGILKTTAESGVILSSRTGIVGPGQRVWNLEIPRGKKALVGVSSRNYDILLQGARIPTETIATFLYKIENFKPKGIADIISHSGTTLSPGELLIRGRYTSVSQVVEGGCGLVTAAIKTFPSIYFDEVQSLFDGLDKSLFAGIVELKAQVPQAYRLSYKDKNRAYMLVYGGANFLAPLVEQGIAGELSISHSIFDSEGLLPVEKLMAD